MPLLSSLRRLPQSRRNPPASLSLCATDLTMTTRRERARADRSGGRFSLVTFAGHSLDEVAQYLAHRVRIIDQFAWTNDGRLWLILPDCPADACVRLAGEICQRFSKERRRISYDLYHYEATSSADRCDRCSMLEERSVPGSGSGGSPRAVESPLVRTTPSWKRVLDLFVAALALVLLSPLLALVAVIIKLTSPGPVLFGQMRAGRSGKPFRILKFRTMTVDAEQRKAELLTRNEQDGPAFKMENDPRVTWVGRLLRATSIDEVPQFWNVLRGEMSLVGPRPLPVNESEGCELWQQERLDVTPGLTCSWQVCDRRSKIRFVEWMRMDIRYARSRALLLDLSLILKTIAFVIRRKGF